MTVRPDMNELARDLGCQSVAPHAIPIRHDLFIYFAAMAKKENTTPAVVINDVLRGYIEGVG